MSEHPGKAGSPNDFNRHARTLFDNMAEGLVICEAIRDAHGRLVDYRVVDANPVFLRRARHGAATIGRTLLAMRPETSSWWFDRCEDALCGEAVRFEFEDGETGRWYDVHMMQLSGDRFGQFFTDITHRKAAESVQRELFDELNHRVKNNLAIISSILELQARGAPPDVRAHLEKAIGRVRTVGDLHTTLYQQNSTDRVDLLAYLETLCEGLRTAMLRDANIRLEARGDTISVAVREAVSLGLIVNELVTNAAKHAFRGRASGAIEVRLAAFGGGLRLSVMDDGVGPQREMVTPGLGLRMVRSLVGGLRGELRQLDGPGFGVEISIPEI